VTLAFDHRNFGASEGEPRQHEDAAGKRQDLIDATSFLAARPEVDADRLASLGICLGASYALLHASFDPRIRALGLVAGGYNEAAAMRAGMGTSATARCCATRSRRTRRRRRPGRSGARGGRRRRRAGGDVRRRAVRLLRHRSRTEPRAGATG
jgi:fermentation-respiration switch protein FrsA (DUF1100 family)